jgi:hypothetical protein
LFKYFDVTEFDEKPIWKYFDKNLEMFDRLNAYGDWKKLVSEYIEAQLNKPD